MTGRISLLNLKRSPTKTVFYVILISVITLFLCSGIELWSESVSLIKNLDNEYSTIGIIEYVGDNYPDTSKVSASTTDRLDSIDIDSIANNPNVISWDSVDVGLGNIQELEFQNKTSQYANYGVLIITNSSPTREPHVYTCHVENTVYCATDYTNYYVQLDNSLMPEFVPSKDGFYAVHGEFYMGYNAYPFFRVLDVEIANQPNIPYQDVTAQYTADRTVPAAYYAIGSVYDCINSAITVCATTGIENLEDFHQNINNLNDGRYFTADEYRAEAKVCIVSSVIMSSIDKKIGDKINLSTYYREQNKSLVSGFFDSTPRAYDEYTIVGVVNTDKSNHFTVYLPSNGTKSASVPGYKLGQATIRNGYDDEFVADITPILPDNTIITVYDQGYATIFAALDALRQLGIILTIISTIVGIVVSGLFAYLFVCKQRDTVTIMNSLGSGKKRIFGYVLFGSNTMAVPSSLASAIVSYFSFGVLFTALFSLVQNLYSYDLRFSSARQGIQNEYSLQLSPKLWVFLTVFVGVLLLINISCCIMTKLVLKNPFRTRKRAKKPVKPRNRKALLIKGGSFKYSAISILRGGMRTSVVLILSLVITIFVSLLNAITLSYNEQLDKAYDTADINVSFTDINGRGIGNLVVDSYVIKNIYDTGLVSDVSVSSETNYLYGGITKYADSDTGNLLDITIPSVTSYAYDTFITRIGQQPNIIYTNSIRTSPEFYYCKSMTVEYQEGFDESSLSELKSVCLVPYSFATANGVSLGDTIHIFLCVDQTIVERDVTVIGLFAKAAEKDSIYCSLPTVVSLDKVLNGKSNEAFRSCSFAVADARKLSELKTAMSDMKLSEIKRPNSVRCFLLIRDKEFLDTLSGVNQNLRYLKAMYVILLVLVIIIGFLVSYLLTGARKNELAILRSIGTSKSRVFFSFFIEQALLCVIGAIVGFAVMSIFLSPTLIGALSVLGFVVFYLIGSSVSVGLMNRVSVLSILAQKE